MHSNSPSSNQNKIREIDCLLWVFYSADIAIELWVELYIDVFQNKVFFSDASNITTTFKETYEINENRNISLECDVDANPLSNITWKFLKTGTVLNNTYNSSNGILEIPSIKCLDHGKYMVVAANGIGRSASKSTTIVVNCE